MGKLPAVFSKDGVTTAANASGLNDAAAAAVFMTRKKADELGIKPLMKLINICVAGVDPYYMGVGPAKAIPKCLQLAGMKYSDIDYWEVNEAFAAQVIGVKKMMKEEQGIDMDMGTVEKMVTSTTTAPESPWDTRWDAPACALSSAYTMKWKESDLQWAAPPSAWVADRLWLLSGPGMFNSID
jgi:Acetyl-CoA acetyltransferase